MVNIGKLWWIVVNFKGYKDILNNHEHSNYQETPETGHRETSKAGNAPGYYLFILPATQRD